MRPWSVQISIGATSWPGGWSGATGKLSSPARPGSISPPARAGSLRTPGPATPTGSRLRSSASSPATTDRLPSTYCSPPGEATLSRRPPAGSRGSTWATTSTMNSTCSPASPSTITPAVETYLAAQSKLLPGAPRRPPRRLRGGRVLGLELDRAKGAAPDRRRAARRLHGGENHRGARGGPHRSRAPCGLRASAHGAAGSALRALPRRTSDAPGAPPHVRAPHPRPARRRRGLAGRGELREVAFLAARLGWLDVFTSLAGQEWYWRRIWDGYNELDNENLLSWSRFHADERILQRALYVMESLGRGSLDGAIAWKRLRALPPSGATPTT